jgi:hypothetical protein
MTRRTEDRVVYGGGGGGVSNEIEKRPKQIKVGEGKRGKERQLKGGGRSCNTSACEILLTWAHRRSVSPSPAVSTTCTFSPGVPRGYFARLVWFASPPSRKEWDLSYGLRLDGIIGCLPCGTHRNGLTHPLALHPLLVYSSPYSPNSIVRFQQQVV